MAMHIEFEAVYVDGKRFVHARHVFPSELYKKAVGWRILELGQADRPFSRPLQQQPPRSSSRSEQPVAGCLDRSET